MISCWSKKSAFLIVLGFTSVSDHAFSKNSESHRLYRSAAYLGRGDTGIADTDNQDAIFYNPAGLAQGDRLYKRFVVASPQIELSSQTREIYQRLLIDKEDQVDVLKEQVGEPLHLGVHSMSALVFRRAALAATLSNSVNALVRKDPEYGGLETVEADLTSNQILSFSLAEQFISESLMLGVTAKYLNRSQAEYSTNIIDARNLKDLDSDELIKTGRSFGVDLGMMLRTSKNQHRQHALGLTLTDLNGTTFRAAKEGTEAPDKLPAALNLGYAYTLYSIAAKAKLLIDYRDITGAYEPNALKRIHIGTDISMHDAIGFSLGLNQGYPTAGAFFDFRLIRVDLGTYTQERGEKIGMYADRRYFCRILVGL